jgi:small subunit ribosomal protein S15
MARMHTRKHGKSKSRKPVLDEKDFGKGSGELSKEQIEELIIEYAKQGTGPAQMGERLKKEHGVKYIRQATGKRLGKILEEKGFKGDIPPDMMDLMKRAVRMRKHIDKNKRDVHSTTRLKRTESKIWRLTSYYIKKGALPAKWRYNPATAELLIRGKA